MVEARLVNARMVDAKRVMRLLAALALLTVGCTDDSTKTGAKPAAAKDAPAKAGATDAPAKTAPKQAASTAKAVVFDPRSPPPGYQNCHRNHCHKVGGGVASYAQVMEEMGATEIVGGAKPKPIPKAPADVADPPADAEWSKSGLASKQLEKGSGTVKPGPQGVVLAHYTAWTREGKGFDSSVARGKPATFPIARIFPGLQEGLQLMTVGESRRFWIPGKMAFAGQRGRPQGMVVFDVELLEIRQ